MTLDLLIALAGIDHDDADSIVERVSAAIVMAVPPEKVGQLFDDAFHLPEPFESWDDKAVAWLYGELMEWVGKVDLSRNPEKLRRKALRKSGKLSPREAKAVDRLIQAVGDDVKLLADIKVLATLNRRERKQMEG